MSAPVVYDIDGHTLYQAECVGCMREMLEDSVDAIVTDPPYGLEFMGKDWDGADGFRRSLNSADVGRDNAFGRLSRKAPEYRSTGAGEKSKPGIGLRQTDWVSSQGWNQFRCESCGHLFHGGSPCRCEAPKPVRADNRWNLFQAWCESWAEAALRIAKPGAHLMAFGGTRTHHRLMVALEDAGWELRDTLMWVYGSGFPKSHDVSKALDKAAGAKREVIAMTRGKGGENLNRLSRIHGADDAAAHGCGAYGIGAKQVDIDLPITGPSTDAAKHWDGWGTALKPAWEPIILARKPLHGTVAENILKWGTGGLNIGACRINQGQVISGGGNNFNAWRTGESRSDRPRIHGQQTTGHTQGRWPANVILDEEAGAMLDHQSGVRSSGSRQAGVRLGMGYHGANGDGGPAITSNTGGASRFFYCAKASRRERGEGNTHPTVKPLALLKYLIRLVTPPNGLILDPFAGSGTTLLAARAEGFCAIGIEQSAEYCEIARQRLSAHIPDALPLFRADVQQ